MENSIESYSEAIREAALALKVGEMSKPVENKEYYDEEIVVIFRNLWKNTHENLIKMILIDAWF